MFAVLAVQVSRKFNSGWHAFEAGQRARKPTGPIYRIDRRASVLLALGDFLCCLASAIAAQGYIAMVSPGKALASITAGSISITQ